MNTIVSIDVEMMLDKLKQRKEQWEAECDDVATNTLKELRDNKKISMSMGSDFYSQEISRLILKIGIMKGYLLGSNAVYDVLAESMLTKLT